MFADEAHRLLGHQYGRDQIALHHPAHLLGGVDTDRAEFPDAGTVDHKGRQAAPGHGGTEGHLHLFVVGQIGGDADHGAAEPLLLLLQLVITAPHHGDSMTALNQSDCQSAPKAGARASHYDMAHYLSSLTFARQTRPGGA
ncbi:hypothetical protein D3C75_731930 [compost metagenome]